MLFDIICKITEIPRPPFSNRIHPSSKITRLVLENFSLFLERINRHIMSEGSVNKKYQTPQAPYQTQYRLKNLK